MGLQRGVKSDGKFSAKGRAFLGVADLAKCRLFVVISAMGLQLGLQIGVTFFLEWGYKMWK